MLKPWGLLIGADSQARPLSRREPRACCGQTHRKETDVSEEERISNLTA